jgi:hypothetical protein
MPELDFGELYNRNKWFYLKQNTLELGIFSGELKTYKTKNRVVDMVKKICYIYYASDKIYYKKHKGWPKIGEIWRLRSWIQ